MRYWLLQYSGGGSGGDGGCNGYGGGDGGCNGDGGGCGAIALLTKHQLFLSFSLIVCVCVCVRKEERV